jgi:RHS repeat-associated protein
MKHLLPRVANLLIALLLCFFTFQKAYSQNISYDPLFTNASFTKTVNVNLPVGTVAASADASSGAGTYTIPIAIPPGTNGVAPSVSITYNSMGGNGIVGQGWGISGLSSIARVGQTIYHDGKTTPVNLDANDRFVLDGMRLLSKSGTYGADGATYGPEVENFSTVVSNGNFGGGPLWFRLESKDGVVMEYGNSTDSRFLNHDNSKVLFWRLNKILYKDGNYIEYKYVVANNESLINEINYTGNAAAGLLPYNKIKFNFLQRLEKTTSYEVNTPVKSQYLLNNIVVTAENSQAFKTYYLRYGHDNITSYLTEFKEAGSNGTLLNTTIFKYGDIPSGFETSSSDVIAGQSVDLFSGDFDADGYSDILAATYALHNNDIKYHTGFKIYKRTATNSLYTLAYNETFPSGELWQIVNKVNTPNNHNFYTSDFTGDGRDDIIINKLGFTSTGNYKVDHYKLYTSTSTGGSSATFSTSTFSPYDHPTVCSGTYDRFASTQGDGQYFFPGDYDGDGATDFVTILSNGTGFKVFLSFPRTGVMNKEIANVNNGCFTNDIWKHAHYHNVIDFNGDGKSELMLTKDDKTTIFSFLPSGSNWSATQVYDAGFPTKWHLLYVGDLNGDGKTDILSRTSKTNNNNPWYKSICTGTGYVETPFSFNHTPDITGVTSDDKLVISDYNGDGKADIFHGWNFYVNGVASTSKFDLYYSKGDNFYYLQHTYNELMGNLPLISYDLNGDGRTDLVNRNYYQDPFDILYLRKEGQEHLLQKIKNGVDHDVEFAYKRLTQTSNFYTRSFVGAHPVNNLQLPLYFISQFKAENGIGGFSTVDYAYDEVKLHKEGKGFLGIKKVTANNLASGMKKVTEMDFNNSFYAAEPYKVSTYLASNNTLLNETTMTTNCVQQGGAGSKRVWVKTFIITENRPFEKRYGSTIRTYDSYGNITNNVTNDGVVSITTTTVYEAFGTPIPAKPTSITDAYHRCCGNSTYSVTSTYGYNAVGQLTSKTDFSGQAQNVVTTYTYNNLGNQTGITVTPAGMPVRNGSSAYDAKGRYALSMTNALGQTASATYDSRWGKALSETGIDGLTKSYNYDAFGRLQTTIMPQGWIVTEVYAWDINATEGTIHYLLTSHPGKPNVKVWYDLLDREKKTQMEGFQNQWITTKTTYDSRGNIATSTTPYKTGEPILTNTNSYDVYNRLVTTTNSIGAATIAYSYDLSGNLTTTMTNPAGQVSSKVTDPSGKTISATDYGGTLSYSYNSQGNLKQVNQGSTVLVLNEYDAYARQTKLTDLNAGVTQYTYDALGQAISEISALNQTTTMSYDLLGRATQRTGPEGTTTNEYFLSGSGASTNKIKKITGFSGDIQEYTYDIYGRTSTDKTTVDGVAHTTTYGYDTYSNVTSMDYPSGFTLNQAYDANGYLVTLKNGNNSVTLFTNTGMNGFNQYKNFTLGNGKASVNTYDFGTPTRYFTTGVQDLNLTWNAQSGNLTSRNDAIKTKTESFTYDNLNRLLTSSGTGIPTLDMTFAGNGNITSKTDAGNYTYGSAKINAVTVVSNPALNISGQTQDITYTPYFQPATISQGSYLLTYTYGSDQQRIKGVLAQNGSTINTRYYFGGYEKDITGSSTKHLHYISNGQNLIAIVVRENGTDTYNYVYTDHIGSILTVTNNSGAIIAEQNFDAWGRKRNTANWSYVGVQAVPAWLYRGFTSHEHLPLFGLINMNGRMYDPLVGRMLSADNNVQMPDFTQNYNRYSYALNNPLRFTDPTGEIVWAPIIVAAVVAGTLNLGIQAAMGNVQSFGDGVKAFGMGALAGALAATGAGTIAAGAYSGFTAAISSNMPGIPIQVGNFTLSVSPALIYGSHGFGAGLNFNANLQIGDVSIGVSAGFTNFNSATGTGKVMSEFRTGAHTGYDNGKFGVTLATTKFTGGSTGQRLGYARARVGDWSFSYENDGTPFSHNLGDGGDSYRTAAGSIGYQDINATMRLFTGARDYSNNIQDESSPGWCGPLGKNCWNRKWAGGDAINMYRMGALSIGYKGYELGWNHDNVRFAFQNKLAHTMISPQAWIPRASAGQQLFGSFRTHNPFTHW